MSTHQIVLAIVCAVLVVFSLTVALVVPKRNQSFPRSLRPFFLVAIALVAGMMATVEFLGGDEKGSEAAAATQPSSTGGQTATGATGTAGGAAQGDPAAGKQVFSSAGCASCHTLADAGATGVVGPSLDQKKPAYDRVIDRVTHGKGAMPAFGDQGILNQKQIQDVAAYVVKATSG